MKRKFLVLSAVLQVICGIALLQSCSSEFEHYSTEEYGYYTEDEITAIEAMAEKYGVSMTIDRNYYGIKQSLQEIENEIIEFKTIEGEYEIVPLKDENGTITYTSKRKEELNSRIITRSSETGSWSGSDSHSTNYDVKVEIKWDLTSPFVSQQISGTGKFDYKYHEIKESLSCEFTEGINIRFRGTVSDYVYGKKVGVEISDGVVYKFREGGTGSFRVSAL